jgi:hypothetical protein
MKTLSCLFYSVFFFSLMVGMNNSAIGQSPVPKATLIQPSNPGIQWVIGTNNLISWTDNFYYGVNLELWNEAKTATVTTIATNVGGSTFTWSTSGAGIVSGNHYYIRVCSTVDPTNNDYADLSDVPFELVTVIPGSVKIYQPSVSGIVWVPGTTHLISWEDSPNETVRIDLYKGGVLITTPGVNPIATGATGSTFSWSIPSGIAEGADYKIRITEEVSHVFVESDHPFELKNTLGGNIRVIQPTEANIEWKKGTNHLISWEDGLSETVNIDLLEYPYDIFKNGGDRLVTTQYADGKWGWPLTAPPTYGNTLGPIAKGLIQSYKRSLSVSQLTAINKAKIALLSKTNNFSPSDGYLAKAIDDAIGGTTCVTYLNTYFYGPLAAGTYNRNGAGTLYNTASYISMIRTNRSGSQANMAAWDLGLGLVGAANCGVTSSELDLWIQGTKDEINEINSADYYDVIGLAGGIYGLAFVHESFDPSSGSFGALASNIQDLSGILASYQINNGGFAWNSGYVIPNDGNESIQETSYAILALNEVDRTVFYTNITGAADYLANVQLPSGGWENYAGSGENNEITGEALWAYSVAYPPNTPINTTSLAHDVSGSTWNWSITQNVGSHYKISVSSHINSAYHAESMHEFAIVNVLAGHINRVIQPAGGEVWLVNTGHLISWEDELEESVNIDLLAYTNGSTMTPTGSVIPVASHVTGSTFPWPTNVPTGQFYRIRISSSENSNISMVSANCFSIVNTIATNGGKFFQPLEGYKWLRNTTYLISWEDNILESVNIDVSDDNGVNFTRIPNGTDVVGSTCLWVSPISSSGNNYQFRISSTINPNIGLKSGFFTIVESLGGGAITINQPNLSGLKWVQGTTNLISWDDNMTEPVKIELCYYGTTAGAASPISTVALPNAPGASSVTGTTFSWSIPESQSTGYYRIKISSTLAGGPSKLAENEFEIKQLIDVGVFPNPCTLYATLQFDESSIENYTIDVFDRYGTRVMQNSINTADSKQITLLTSDLPNGIYFINMTAGQTKISKKIVVQH